jgi:hypothetical protein
VGRNGANGFHILDCHAEGNRGTASMMLISSTVPTLARARAVANVCDGR